ncbi:hypothetical protein K2X83_00550 [Patescibacteria group bacterium]|nr:hypothetical protein [Patescibacteria group bacterium]
MAYLKMEKQVTPDHSQESATLNAFVIAMCGLSKSGNRNAFNWRVRRFMNVTSKALRDAGLSGAEQTVVRKFLFERFPYAKTVTEMLSEEKLHAVTSALPRVIVDTFWERKKDPFVRTMLGRMGAIPHAYNPDKDQERGIEQTSVPDDIRFTGVRGFLCSGSEHYFHKAARDNIALLVNNLFFTKSQLSETGEIVGTPTRNARLASGYVALKDVLYVPVNSLRYQGIYLQKILDERENPSRTLRTASVEPDEWTPLRALRTDRFRGRKATAAIKNRLLDLREHD